VIAGPGNERSVWLLTDAAMDAHAAPGHPERPERRAAAAAGVRDAAGPDLHEPPVTEASLDEIAAVHDPDYVAVLDEAEQRGGGWLDPDTYLVPGSVRAARLAAGATVMAAKAVAEERARVAFAAVRPPGHHATVERGTGFCLFNSVAIAAESLRRHGRARRIAIVDWDVHHGDGTQAIFDADPDVCYASTHQWPYYPGTGTRGEVGLGEGQGTMHNRPLEAGAGDEPFLRAWRDDLLPAIEAFGPDAILVSAGYDAHAADPLAMLEVTEAGYATLARDLGVLARRLGLPGVALTLEGGYDLDALRASVAVTVAGLREGLAAEADAG
jgi:acetoin utilization deacetylase AcuC-like enzyme